jgi:DNA polymerase-3 subunit alpha
MTEAFIKRKHGKEKVTYLHPLLETILGETFGVIVYQEQVMQIVSQLGGFTMAQADLMRKVISKKDSPPELVEQQRKAFVKGAEAKGIDANTAGKIFDQIAPFAQYGFNKPHTTCYALLAYQTAYLKANYPLEFMSSLLTVEAGNSDKVAAYVEECRRMGIEILPPDVNASRAHFTTEEGAIRFGLSGIKNVGGGAIDSIVAERTERGNFQSLADFATRVDVRQCNRRVVESLIKGGAFDSLGFGRRRLFEAIDRALELGAKSTANRNSLQLSLLGGQEDSYLPDILDDYPEWSDEEMLAHEKEMLGFYLSSHPLKQHQQALSELRSVSLARISEYANGSILVIAGLIIDMRQIQDRRGRDMAFITLEDQSGQLEVIAFADSFARSEFFLFKGTVVVVQGKLQSGEQGTKLIAENIYPLEEAPLKLAKSLHIRVPRRMITDEGLMGELHETIARNSKVEGCLVYLHLPEGEGEEETVARLSMRMRLKPSAELMEQINALLGDEGKTLVWTEVEE